MKFEVQFYEKENGERPVKEFLLSLDEKMKAKLTGLLGVLEEKGNDISRVLYFFCYEGKIVVTNGFIKKTQKTPRKQIKIAKERRKDYIERMEKQWKH